MKNSDNIVYIEAFIEHQNSLAAVSLDVFVFSLGRETYGIDLGKVKMLLGIQHLVRVIDDLNQVVGVISA